jgi:hypothetical protein
MIGNYLYVCTCGHKTRLLRPVTQVYDPVQCGLGTKGFEEEGVGCGAILDGQTCKVIEPGIRVAYAQGQLKGNR